jgi:hypothetical protein
MPRTWLFFLFFFFSFSYTNIPRRTTEQNRELTYCVTNKIGTGTGEWAMESECATSLCFASLSCLSHPPNLPGCSVSEDSKPVRAGMERKGGGGR